MERCIAVDSGKSATKVAVYNKEKNQADVFKFRTRIGKGNFQDDAIEMNTAVVSVQGVPDLEGTIFKVGNGATVDAETVTTKKTVTHKLCTLFAIASICSEHETDQIHAAIGIPVKNWENVDERMDYKEFILPDGEITIQYKTANMDQPVKKTFTIISKHVYQETLGALFISDNVNTGHVAVIDIGHLNTNQTVYDNLEVSKQFSLTDTSGGNALVTGLAQELSSAFSLVDESVVAKVLNRTGTDRCLKPKHPNKEIEARSKEIIDEYMLNHVRNIRRNCDSKRWAVDYMDFIFIGGTTHLLQKEIYEVFGDEVVIPDNPEYANVIGFLRILCGKLLKIVVNIKK